MTETYIYIFLAALSFIVGCSGVAMTINKRFAYLWVRWNPSYFFLRKSGESKENTARAFHRFYGPIYIVAGFGAAIWCIILAMD